MQTISILTPALTGGGAERVAQNLAVGLTRCRARVQVLTLAPDPARADTEQAAATALEEFGVRVSTLPARSARTAIPALVKAIRRDRPSVLISHLEYLNVTAILSRLLSFTRTRVVAVNHIQLSVDTRSNKDCRVRLMPWLARLAYPLAHQVVCVSRGSADDLSQTTGLPRERIKVIYNPVIGQGFRKRLMAEAVHPWFAKDQRPVFISAGRMVTQKDFGTLLSAFALLRRMRVARLVIFGDGPQREALEQTAWDMGIEKDVCFMGYVENLPAYMKRARAFVLSSKWEALPTVLIEALAAGCRVISTDCPSGPREILADGKHGRLVPVGSVSALAIAMLDELNDQRQIAPLLASWRPYLEATVCREYLQFCPGQNT
jgi:glycosyltransferase involved in cell wall biosynthesis